jgi:hypothetical protein
MVITTGTLESYLVSAFRATELDLPEMRITLTPHLPCPDDGAKMVDDQRDQTFVSRKLLHGPALKTKTMFPKCQRLTYAGSFKVPLH